ncbi:glycoside hydrolase family 43 protein [Herbiconiux moechotypicola]|uniref:Glycoside hydrolase family 43 protein n=1 Tax=Herbiconiux moechotypicola TaxID=637393 RepID=A0ABN3DP89_9MICO|nr:glycoside hydrolase family 43 protein [Herbiconiux moechotypicola]MCS5730489.1 glycoside hydrolase family 43 protein [Herbiconiux moechotypicola]
MGRYRNPVLTGCHPDPSLCRVGDEFFLVTSTFEYLPGLPVHRSTNLVDWEPLGHAIDRSDQLDLSALAGSRGLYAPTIRHDGQRFLVVCTVVGPDPTAPPAGGATGHETTWHGRTGHFAVTATDARGPWSDPVWIDGVGGFDPSLTIDGDSLWLCGTEPASPAEWPGQTNVWVVELDPASFQALGAPTVIWQGALAGAVWAEGPHILARPGGGWMLVAAEGGTAREHAVCVAYADEITGPYRGDPGNPRLTHRDLGGLAPIAAVGHADLVDDTAGRTWATVLATTPVDGEDGLLGRQTHLVPVEWEDGRPVFAPGEARVRAVMEADGVPDQAPAPTVFDDGFDASELDLAWNGVGRHPSEFATPGSPGTPLLLSGGAEPASLGPQSFLGRRLPHAAVDASVTLRSPVSGAGPESGLGSPSRPTEGGALRGGLLLRTSERAHLELAVDSHGTAICSLVADGIRTALAEATTVDDPLTVLELRIRHRRAAALVDGVTVAEADLTALVPDQASGFVGAWIGPFAVGRADESIEVERVTLLVRAEEG